MEEGPPKSVTWMQASNQPVVLESKAWVLSNCVKLGLEPSKVSVMEMNESEPLLSGVEREMTMRKATA